MPVKPGENQRMMMWGNLYQKNNAYPCQDAMWGWFAQIDRTSSSFVFNNLSGVIIVVVLIFMCVLPTKDTGSEAIDQE